MWGTVLKRDLLGETREEDKFRSKEQLKEYLESEIEKQGEDVVIRNLDVSLIEDFKYLFADIARRVKTLDLSGWKTSNAKNMSGMFWYCLNLKSLDLSGWDISNVENMSAMFSGCISLESLDLSGWDTSNVKIMPGMFFNCRNLESLDLSGWDTSNAHKENMFFDCPAPYKVIDNKIVKK